MGRLGVVGDVGISGSCPIVDEGVLGRLGSGVSRAAASSAVSSEDGVSWPCAPDENVGKLDNNDGGLLDFVGELEGDPTEPADHPSMDGPRVESTLSRSFPFPFVSPPAHHLPTAASAPTASPPLWLSIDRLTAP